MRPKIKIVSLGGTISMRSEGAGLNPALGAEALAADLARRTPQVELIRQDLGRVASANLDLALVNRLSGLIAGFAAEGGRGVIVTQGTDTLEETAFLTELLGTPALPVAFTGAMRGASADSPDGPANLADALAFVTSPSAGAEVVVVMNGQVHAARHAQKTDTTALDAFSSRSHAPRGRLHEGRFIALRPPFPPLPSVGPRRGDASPRVWIATIGLDMDETLFTLGEDAGPDGWVIAALGAGHVPEKLAPVLGRLARKAPVVLCSRTGGMVCERTYGYAGAEIDLLSRGLLAGGSLSPAKARVALLALLGDGRGDVARRFAELAARVRDETSPDTRPSPLETASP
ncbi:asparaginase [uncultured Caulobacter sp.]|uniref:asparaginase n=1 Tax=uncultured Caulobacter sp. TaxID=158749 RepID=UPI00260A20A4|nr:asparaginase [uncultured Caulobacter sp.]